MNPFYYREDGSYRQSDWIAHNNNMIGFDIEGFLFLFNRYGELVCVCKFYDRCYKDGKIINTQEFWAGVKLLNIDEI